jgi:hypothetical protein
MLGFKLQQLDLFPRLFPRLAIDTPLFHGGSWQTCISKKACLALLQINATLEMQTGGIAKPAKASKPQLSSHSRPIQKNPTQWPGFLPSLLSHIEARAGR